MTHRIETTEAAMKSTSTRKSNSIHRSCRRRDDLHESNSNSLSLSRCFLLLQLFVLVSSCISFASAFQSSSSSSSISTRTPPTDRLQNCHSQPYSSFALCAMPGFNNNNNNDNNKNNNEDEDKDIWNGNNLFESFKSFFWNKETDGFKFPTSDLFQPPPTQSSSSSSLGQLYNTNDEGEEDDELPAGTFLLFKFPAKQLKPGGLRLFLMFYLLGMQNTPDKNTWRADQKLMESLSSDVDEEKTYVLEMLYDVDKTGMLQIELLPSTSHQKQAEIRIYRCGSRPSTSYLMQESLIVDGVLDELQNIAGEKIGDFDSDSDAPDGDEPEIAAQDRLLITDPPNAIGAARKSLAFS